MSNFFTIAWRDGSVVMIDQRRLPMEEVYNTYTSSEQVAEAIEVMVIRGAPAIGIAAAMGVALAAQAAASGPPAAFRAKLEEAVARLHRTRPTAVNLFWALERMKKLIAGRDGSAPADIAAACIAEARRMLDEDVAINRRMGAYGAEHLADGDVVLTHCNAGALATGGYGTALGVIRAAIEQGKRIEVFADETRPFLQGARLTVWELMKDNIPVTLITDNMAGHLMKLGKINKVITGADRVAANGDAANKIGTYSVAVLAKRHSVPFFIAAPLSTIDLATKTGDDIPIEDRKQTYEITHVLGTQIVPNNTRVLYPAFDVTPASFITALFTEAGVAEPPDGESVGALFEKAGKKAGK
jgi:methylthioribose-1-phosphate isomerase